MERDKRLVFLYRVPFIESFVNKYSLWELVDLGYRVDILDLSSLLEPAIGSQNSAKLSQDKRFNIYSYTNFWEVEDYIKKHNEDSIFFPMFDYIYNARHVFNLFTKYSVEYVYTNTLLSPLLYSDAISNDFSINKERLSPQHLKAAFYHRITRKVIPHKVASSIFFCGENGEDFYFLEGACGKKTKKEYLYSFDYENLINAKAYDNDGSKYCLYIDQYLPFHPEIIIRKDMNVDPNSFYKELEIMLKTIEQKMGIEMIIAAHPQANYKEKEYLKDFKIVYGGTASLSKNAELICTHFSTASIFAVMLNKPLLLLNLESIRHISLFQNSIKTITAAMGAREINKVADLVRNDIILIDQKKYDKCMVKNISRVSPDGRFLWERVLDLV